MGGKYHCFYLIMPVFRRLAIRIAVLINHATLITGATLADFFVPDHHSRVLPFTSHMSGSPE